MARITHELGFIYFVDGIKFADKSEAERYYNIVVEREKKYASSGRYKKEDTRNREQLCTSDSD